MWLAESQANQVNVKSASAIYALLETLLGRLEVYVDGLSENSAIAGCAWDWLVVSIGMFLVSFR